MHVLPIPFPRHTLARVVAAGSLLLASTSHAELILESGYGVIPVGISNDGRFIVGNDYSVDQAYLRGSDGAMQLAPCH